MRVRVRYPRRSTRRFALRLSTAGNRALGKFEAVTIALLQFLLVVVVAVATTHLFVLLFTKLPSSWADVQTADDLHRVMQRAFGGVLIVVLGLELIETLKVYFREHKVRVEVIMIVSLIAVGRHIIQVDYEHVAAAELVGLGVLVVALAVGYFLVAKAHGPDTPHP
jgi:uncharacterized membrane protein (DUF373 family)